MMPLAFWTISLLLLGAATLVVLLADPVASALCLALASIFLGALYIALDARFLGVVQILVYTGAVIVLFLFIIMLLDLRAERARRPPPHTVLGAAIVVGALVYQLAAALAGSDLAARSLPPLDPAAAEGARQLGVALFTRFHLPLQIVAGILLIATVGVVVLGKRELK